MRVSGLATVRLCLPRLGRTYLLALDDDGGTQEVGNTTFQIYCVTRQKGRRGLSKQRKLDMSWPKTLGYQHVLSVFFPLSGALGSQTLTFFSILKTNKPRTHRKEWYSFRRRSVSRFWVLVQARLVDSTF